MTRSAILGGSVVAGILAAGVATLAAGAGHGTYAPAKFLFPYSMVLTRVTGTITNALIVLACIQYPVYGILLSLGWRSSGRQLVTVALAAIHIGATIAAMVVSDASYSP